LVSSVVYIINDIADIEADRQHPKKKLRPLPSGKLSVRAAWVAAALIVATCLPLAYWLSPGFALVVAAYLVINLAYSRWLKHIPILDVFIIAAGFVLRVEAGVTLIVVERFSPWLYLVTTLGALYLGFGKRRAELTLLAKGAGSHRKVLDGYSLPLLDQYITIVATATVVFYSFYTFTAENMPPDHSMMLTIPFFIYIIFRYQYLVHMTDQTGAPDEVLLTDRPMQIALALMGLTIFAVFYFAR
jgi:4-hydroxybenzoate polyprenyltransferase